MKITYSYDGTVAANLVEDKDIVNDLTSGGTNKVLSAEQGKTLKGLIDDIDVPEGIGADVTELQTKMTAVEQKNTQQDTSISQLQTDVDAVEQKNTQQDTSIADLQAKLEKALFLENPNV